MGDDSEVFVGLDVAKSKAYAVERDPAHRADDRQRDQTHHRRQGLSRPRHAGALQHARVRLRAEARRHAGDQARAQAEIGSRARDWAPQERSPPGPQLPDRYRRRRGQRRARRRRLQLRKAAGLGQRALPRAAGKPARDHAATRSLIPPRPNPKPIAPKPDSSGATHYHLRKTLCRSQGLPG